MHYKRIEIAIRWLKIQLYLQFLYWCGHALSKLLYFFKNIRVEIALTLIEILDKYWHDFGHLTVVLYISDNVIDDDSERFEFQTSQTDRDWESDDDKIIWYF